MLAGACLLVDGARRLAQGPALTAAVDRLGVPRPQVVGPVVGVAEALLGAALLISVLAVALGIRSRWARAGAIAVVGVVPIVIAVASGYGGILAARCNEDRCPAVMPDPDRRFGVKRAPSDGGPPLRSRVVVGGLEFPTAIAFTEDGRMVVNERAGRVRIVENGSLRPAPLALVPTTTAGERGLLGAAVAPDGRSVYVFATEPDGNSNRVVAVSLLDGSQRTVVDELAGGIYHDGGGLAFDRSGLLFVSNGEAHSSGRAQDLNASGGKVYRFTADGEPAGENPFGRSAVFALGLRNPFGLALDPRSGAVFVTENGPDGHDEVNRVDRGANLGWPDIKGVDRVGSLRGDARGRYADPLLDFRRTVVPTGITFSPDGDLYFATYAEGAIHRVRLDETRRRVESDTVVLDAGAPVVAMAWGPDGLYYSTGDEVRALESG